MGKTKKGNGKKKTKSKAPSRNFEIPEFFDEEMEEEFIKNLEWVDESLHAGLDPLFTEIIENDEPEKMVMLAHALNSLSTGLILELMGEEVAIDFLQDVQTKIKEGAFVNPFSIQEEFDYVNDEEEFF